MRLIAPHLLPCLPTRDPCVSLLHLLPCLPTTREFGPVRSDVSHCCTCCHACTPGNSVPSAPMCVQYDALKTLLRETKGFDFVEDGPKKKKGFVGLHPGEKAHGRVEGGGRVQGGQEGGADIQDAWKLLFSNEVWGRQLWKLVGRAAHPSGPFIPCPLQESSQSRVFPASCHSGL